MRCSSLAALLAVSLASCATSAPRALPPVEFLQDCGTIPPKPKTNGELSRQREALIADLKQCNRDKANLRAWQEGQK